MHPGTHQARSLDGHPLPGGGQVGLSCPGLLAGPPWQGCSLKLVPSRHFDFRHAPDCVRVAENNWPPCRLCGIQMAAAGMPGHEASKTCRYMPLKMFPRPCLSTSARLSPSHTTTTITQLTSP